MGEARCFSVEHTPTCPQPPVLLQRTSRVRQTGLGPRAPVTPGVRHRRSWQNSGATEFHSRGPGGRAHGRAFQERLARVRAADGPLGAQGAQDRKPASGRRTRELGDLAIDSNSGAAVYSNTAPPGPSPGDAARPGARSAHRGHPPSLLPKGRAASLAGLRPLPPPDITLGSGG